MTQQCEIPAGNPDSAEIDEILKTVKTIAVVGLSPKEDRPSYRVAAYLQAQGYRIVPVTPAAEEILGERAYGDLSRIPARRHDRHGGYIPARRRRHADRRGGDRPGRRDGSSGCRRVS